MLPAPASSPTRSRRLPRLQMPSLPGMCLRASPVKDALSAPAWAPDQDVLPSACGELRTHVCLLVKP